MLLHNKHSIKFAVIIENKLSKTTTFDEISNIIFRIKMRERHDKGIINIIRCLRVQYVKQKFKCGGNENEAYVFTLKIT